MHKRIFAAIFIMLLIGIPIVFAYSNTWNEDFTTDNMRLSGSYSYDYWLNESDSTEANATFDYSISNSILTLIASKTGSLSSNQEYKFARLLDISGETTIQIKFCFESSQIAETYIWYYATNSTDSPIIGMCVNPANTLKVYDTNTTKDLDSHTLGTSLSANQWYILKINYTEIPLKYNITLTYANGTKINSIEITDAYYPLSSVCKVVIQRSIASGASDGYCRFYFDYIKHSYSYHYDDIMSAFIPVIIAIAMLSTTLGFMKKMMQK